MTAFCRMEYLKSLSAGINFDFVEDDNINRAKVKIDLLDFLLNGAVIKTDLSPDEIEPNFENPFIKSLMRKGKLKSAKEQFELLEIKDGDDFFSKINECSSVLMFN